MIRRQPVASFSLRLSNLIIVTPFHTPMRRTTAADLVRARLAHTLIGSQSQRIRVSPDFGPYHLLRTCVGRSLA